MKRFPFSQLPLIVISAALIFLLAGVAWSRSYNPFGPLKGSSDPVGTMFVSQDAPLSLSLGVNPDRLLSIRPPLSFGKSKTQDELENFRDSILGLRDFDYKAQIQPWLGDELTLAVTSLDVDRDTADGRQPGYLMVLTTQDAAASQAFLKAFWRSRSPLPAILTTEAYQGTEITYGKVKSTLGNKLPKTDNPFTLASAVVGNRYVLFANSPKVLKNSINNVQAPDLNLRNAAVYQRSIAALGPNRFGQLYINLPQFAALTGDRSIAKALAQLPETSPVSYTHLAIGLKGTRSGLVGETVLVSEDSILNSIAGETKSSSQTTIPKPRPVLQYLPANSMAIAVGEDLAQVWKNIGQTIKGYGALERLTNNAIAPLKAQSQLDLVKDIFQWVKGDYGMALLPPVGKNPNQPIDWVFAVNRSTSPDIQSGIDHLDKIAHDRGFNIGPVQLGKNTIQAWTKLSSVGALTNIQAKAIAAHATIGDFELFSTSIETLEKILNESTPTLEKSADWQTIAHEIPASNEGYLSLDWQSAKPLLEKQVPGLRLLELLAQPIVTHLKSFTLSSSGSHNEIAKGTIEIGLK